MTVRMMTVRIFAVLVIGGLVLALNGCGGPPPRLEVGAAMPAFELPDLDGRMVKSRDLAEKPMVINFWATWCGNCRAEMPALQELAANGTRVVGIALDEGGAAAVRPFVEEKGIAYDVLIGNQKVFEKFSGLGIPHTVVVDPAQNIAAIYRGALPEQELRAQLQRIASGG